MISDEFIECPVCSKRKPKTDHHIYPRCWFVNSDRWASFYHGMVYQMCAQCHKELEEHLEEAEEQIGFSRRYRGDTHPHPSFFFVQLIRFLGGITDKRLRKLLGRTGKSEYLKIRRQLKRDLE